MNELISIIVPIYNVENYLDECVKSIIAQTYKNLEIILVDDGSTDDSGKKCDEWGRKDNRVKVIHKENGGLSDARNVGIDCAKGKYISFIDSDDYIEKDMIEYLLNLIIEKHTEISVCNYKKVYENKVFDFKNPKPKREKVKKYSSLEALRQLLKDKKIQNYAWNKLYLKELFTEECYYPVGRKMEDIGTTYLLFYNAKNIAVSNLIKYNYRQRKGSIVNNQDVKFIIDKFELSKERFHSINNKNIELIENYIDYTNKFLEIYRKDNEEIKKYIEDKKLIEEFKNDIKKYKFLIFVKANLKTKIKLLLFYKEIKKYNENIKRNI